MWVYRQRTGEICLDDKLVAVGYSGYGFGKNDPSAQRDHGIGPIPTGVYRIGDPYDSADHGPFVMTLFPDSRNRMYGRSGFLIHGDSKEHPGEASHGCIILPRPVRETIHLSGDTTLVVLSGMVNVT